MQGQCGEDVVVEQAGFADLGSVEQFRDPRHQIALRHVGDGREAGWFDPSGDAAEDPPGGIGAGATRSTHLPFVQVEVLGAWVGERGADVGGVDSGGGQGGHRPIAAEAAAGFLIGAEPVGAAQRRVLGLGR